MNQILVTKKIYVTPELKRKKNFYKIEFFLSIFLVCVLFSFYIYAEYDRNKSEAVGKMLLENTDFAKLTNEEEIIWTFVLGEENYDTDEVLIQQEELQAQMMPEIKDSEGEPYFPIATISISKINVEYAVLSRTSDELLKISPTKFRGPEPNEIGNLCIVGHNYRNDKFFSKVPTLVLGDTLDLTDSKGRTITYELYNKYEVLPNDKDCLSQDTNGKREITLITCTNSGEKRVIAKFREKKIY